MSRVRDALVTSVTWAPPRVPPVRFQTSHVSMLAKSARPVSAARLSPATFSRSQRSLGPEK